MIHSCSSKKWKLQIVQLPCKGIPSYKGTFFATFILCEESRLLSVAGAVLQGDCICCALIHRESWILEAIVYNYTPHCIVYCKKDSEDEY